MFRNKNERNTIFKTTLLTTSDYLHNVNFTLFEQHGFKWLHSRHENLNKMRIPHDIQAMTAMYCKKYEIYSIGGNSNNIASRYFALKRFDGLLGDPLDCSVNGYGVNIKSILNELYINTNHHTLSKIDIEHNKNIKLTSSGIANTKKLFLYTMNDKLYKSKVHRKHEPQVYDCNNSLYLYKSIYFMLYFYWISC